MSPGRPWAQETPALPAAPPPAPTQAPMRSDPRVDKAQNSSSRTGLQVTERRRESSSFSENKPQLAISVACLVSWLLTSHVLPPPRPPSLRLTWGGGGLHSWEAGAGWGHTSRHTPDLSRSRHLATHWTHLSRVGRWSRFVSEETEAGRDEGFSICPEQRAGTRP